MPYLDSGIPGTVVTSADLSPVVENVTQIVVSLLPFVLSLAGIFLVVTVVPRVVSRFTRC